MTERKRSRDKSSETTGRIPGDAGAPGGQGRAGGRLARDVGTRDEEKRAIERPAGPTRVHKSDERQED